MVFKKHPSITKEVLYSGLVFAGIALIVFGAVFFASFGITSIERAKDSIRETNIKAGLITSGIFKEVSNIVEILAGVPEIAALTAADGPGADTALRIYKQASATNEDIGYIYSGHPDGSLLIYDYIPPDGYNATERPWYTSALEEKPGQSFGLPYRDAKTHEWLISQSKALVDAKGEVNGVLAIDVFPDRANALLEEEKEYRSQQSFVLDPEGKAVIHPDSDMLGRAMPRITERLTGKQGWFSYQGKNGKRWAFYNIVDKVNWCIVTTVERSEVINPILLRTSVYALCIALFAMSLAMLQSWYFGKRIAAPLITLGKRVGEIVESKPKTEVTYDKSNHEIAAIANNIEELTERALQRRANELKTIIESSRDGILVVDNNRRVVYTNSRFKEMWQLPGDIFATLKEEQRIQYILDQVQDPEAFYSKVNALYASPREDWDTIMLKDGRIFEFLSCPILNEGRVNGILWTFRDITEKKLAEDRLQRMATTDSLTGLFNRQYFETELSQALAQVRRYGRDTSLIMFDLDHFKAVNDNHGHNVGDKVLVELAKRSRASLRDSDIPARWGGEEFIIILPETEEGAAGEVAERLRGHMEAEPFFHVGRVTISLGVTGILSADTKDSLLKRLDDALYEAKRLGRNRVAMNFS